MALLVGPTSGRHAYERDRRDADGDRAEVAAKLPDNLIPQWYAYYINKNVGHFLGVCFGLLLF
jgi:hypothetical protein